MAPLTLLLVLSAAPIPPRVDPGVAALEAALQVAPSDALRLAIAEQWAAFPDRCGDSIQAYHRFFDACADCAIKDAAILDLTIKIGFCFDTLEAQNRFRAEHSLVLGEPDLPAPATCAEIRRLETALFDNFHSIGPLLGCRDRRGEFWQKLLKVPVSGAEVMRLLELTAGIDPEWVGWVRQETAAAEAIGATTTLEALREEVLVHFADPQPFESCVVASATYRRGWVTVNTLPESEVYLDGVSVGTTPIARRSMEVGTNAVYLKDLHSDRAFKFEAEVEENYVSVYQVPLEKLEPLSDPIETVLPESRQSIEKRHREPACVRVDAKRHWIGGNFADAAAGFERCTQHNPGAWDCWRSLAAVESRQGHAELACRAYRRYLALRPRAPDASWVWRELLRCPE